MATFYFELAIRYYTSNFTSSAAAKSRTRTLILWHPCSRKQILTGNTQSLCTFWDSLWPADMCTGCEEEMDWQYDIQASCSRGVTYLFWNSWKMPCVALGLIGFIWLEFALLFIRHQSTTSFLPTQSASIASTISLSIKSSPYLTRCYLEKRSCWRMSWTKWPFMTSWDTTIWRRRLPGWLPSKYTRISFYVVNRLFILLSIIGIYIRYAYKVWTTSSKLLVSLWLSTWMISIWIAL